MKDDLFRAILVALVGRGKPIMQLELAAETCIGQSTLSGYAHGKTRSPNPEYKKAVIEAIERILEVDRDTVIEMAEEKMAEKSEPWEIVKTDKYMESVIDVLSKRYKMEPLDNQPASFKDKYREKHVLAIDGFTDHEIPLEINQDMVEIQKIDAKVLEDVRDYVKMKLDKLKERSRSHPNKKAQGE